MAALLGTPLVSHVRKHSVPPHWPIFSPSEDATTILPRTAESVVFGLVDGTVAMVLTERTDNNGHGRVDPFGVQQLPHEKRSMVLSVITLSGYDSPSSRTKKRETLRAR